FLSDNTYIKTTLVGYTSDSYYRRDSTNYHYVAFPEYKTDFIESRGAISVMINKKINAHHTIRMGGIFSDLFYHFENHDYSYTPSPVDYATFSYRGSSFLSQAYAQWKYKLVDNLTLNTGVH